MRALTAELATMSARQAQIVAELQGAEEALLAVRRPTLTIDREALAIGLLWKKPDIPVTQLARQVGVTARTLYRWRSVRSILNARAGEKRQARQGFTGVTSTDWDEIDAQLDDE